MPEHGLTEDALSETDVLVFLNHMFQDEFQDEIAERVQNHVLAGMGLVVLHSGHYSKILKRLLGTIMTLRWRHGDREWLFCTCPAYPIAQGIPPFFDIPKEEMYGALFGRGGLAGMELSVFYDHILEAAHQTGKSTSEILKYCHDIGINGLEMNFSFLDENKKAVCSELSDSGMKISCLYEMFDFGRNKDTSKGKRMIEAALEMKAPNILVVPGEMESWEAAELSACSDAYDTAEQYMDQSASIQNMQCALTELVGYAAKTGIQVTLEDFDGL